MIVREFAFDDNRVAVIVRAFAFDDNHVAVIVREFAFDDNRVTMIVREFAFQDNCVTVIVLLNIQNYTPRFFFTKCNLVRKVAIDNSKCYYINFQPESTSSGSGGGEIYMYYNIYTSKNSG